MGWFSAKKKIYVSSTAYNLAGDIEKRVQYLPSTIMSKVVSNNNASIGEVIQSAMIRGPGLRLKKFARWARESGYTDAIGQTAGKLSTSNNIDINNLTTQLQAISPDGLVSIQSAQIDEAEYGSWADQWMLDNHPDRVAEDYEIDFDEVNNWIFIRWPDNSYYQFQPVDFDVSARYLFVSYTITASNVEQPVVPGTRIIVGSPAGYPPAVGWDWIENANPATSFVLNNTVVTTVSYSDGRPGSTSSSTSTTNQTINGYWQKVKKDTIRGNNVDGTELIADRQILTTGLEGYVETVTYSNSYNETIEEGVTRTTSTTTYDDQTKIRYYYQMDTQVVALRKWSKMKTLIYKQNTGNPVYDAMFEPKANSGAFFPFIPIRLDTRFLDEAYYPEILALNKIALKKAIGSKYDDLITSISHNGNMRDIDYAYAVFGVSLNTKENACRKYLFKFFEYLVDAAAESSSEFPNWKFNWNQADVSQKAWVDWKEAQDVPANPLYGLPEPTRLPYPEMPVKKMNVASANMNYDMRLVWTSMAASGGAGLGKPDAKVNDCWIVQGPSVNYNELLVSGGLVDGRDNSVDSFTIYWQETPYNYRSIGVWGLEHGNFIYKGKAVITSANDAFADSEESGFIIPLHEGVYREMSLKDATQMSTACCYIVFNCYQVVKQKWYQTGWFKIILIIVIIVITVMTAGAGAGSAGLLGTAASVGATLGFAGTMAIIVGSIANAVAGMLLSQILMMGATALFGEKIGAIVGAIASVVAVSVGSSAMNGQGLSAGFSSLSSAESLLKLTVAAGNGLSEYLGAELKDTIGETQKLIDEYAGQTKRIQETYEANIGFGNVAFDPTILTDSTKWAFTPESSNTFLSRTLMTGTDIAGMTNDLLTNFTNITLSTELQS